MKKMIALLMSTVMVFMLGACANQNEPTSSSKAPSTGSTVEETEESNATTEEQDNRVLIVYYSYSGVTEGVSEMLQEKTGGDIFELIPTEAYSDDMYEASDRAAEELESGNLPELSGVLPDLADYDTILIGGPVWSEKAAPPVVSYLSQTDFDGKAVAPFLDLSE